MESVNPGWAQYQLFQAVDEHVHILLRVLVYFSMSKRQDLIDIFEAIRVATQRKVCQRDTKSGDVHDRQVRSSLQDISSVFWEF